MGIAVQITFDCADPDALADFWALALDYVKQPPPEGFDTWPDFLTSVGVPAEDWNSRSAVVDPAGEGPRVFFQRVPEGKSTKNRVHLDVNVGEAHDLDEDERRGRVESHAGRLVAAGATRGETFEEHGDFWIVMADPEGNEFCLQ